VDAADFIVLQIIDKTIRNSKFRCISYATPYRHNVFTFTLFQPEGRTGVSWEPSNKMMLFLPPSESKVSLTSPLNFLFESTLHLSFPSLSLSGFKGLIFNPLIISLSCHVSGSHKYCFHIEHNTTWELLGIFEYVFVNVNVMGVQMSVLSSYLRHAHITTNLNSGLIRRTNNIDQYA
jgi:hypothetical protein